MKISAFVLLLSLLSNFSFASFSGDTLTVRAAHENTSDTASGDALKTNLCGEWTNISQNQLNLGFTSLSFLSNGKFKGMASDGKRVCGFWELSADGFDMVLHKMCEETGVETETVVAHIELVDGHMLTLRMSSEQGGKQTFIQ